MDDHSSIAMTRREALQRLGAAAAAAGLIGQVPGLLPSAFAQASATSITGWNFRPEYKNAIEALDKAFAKANPGVSMSMQYKPSAQYDQLLKTALVGGAAPDTWAANTAEVFGPTGLQGKYIVPIDLSSIASTINPAPLAAITRSGKTYAVPVSTFKIGIYYQRPIFRKYGLSAPKTWDDLKAIGAKLKANGVTAMAMPAQDMIIPWFFYAMAVSSILGPDGFKKLLTGERKLTDPDLLPAAQLMLDMGPYYNSGYQAVGYAEGKALFAEGQAAMIIGGSSDYAGYVQADPNIDAGYFGFPPPKATTRPVAMEGLAMAFVVNAKSKKQAAAKQYASWWVSKPAQTLVLNNLGLPVRLGLKPTGNTARARVLHTILSVPSVPSWLDYTKTAGTFTAALSSGGTVFASGGTAASFAAMQQGAVLVPQ